MEYSLQASHAPLAWHEALASALKTLGVAGSQCDQLLRAFTQIAHEWQEHPSAGRTLFASGVCPDGSPVELSLQLRREGHSQVRFIAQPCAPQLPRERQASWAAQRVLEFVRDWAGPDCHTAVRQALSIFPAASEPSFTGNFWFWLGFSSTYRGDRAVKVYYNPWATKPDYQGAYAIHHLLACAGLSTDPLRTLLNWTDGSMPAIPHIVGWNLTSDHVSSVKLYAHGRFDLRSLERCVPGDACASRSWQKLAQSGCTMRPRGEVHLALVCRPGVSPSVRVNLFSPDWFGTDQQALQALQTLLVDWPPDAWEGIQKLCRNNTRCARVINFLGVDDESATVYVNLS